MHLRTVLATTVTLLALVVSGCSSETGEDVAGGPAGERSVEHGAGEREAGAESDLLTDLGLEGLGAVEIVDALDASTQPRPLPFGASVNASQVLLTDGEQEVALDLPEEEFYLSVAPFVDSTHDCYFHSLATCQGELTEEPVQVTITDADGAVLVQEEVTTGSNGFAGFWLPRDITGTIEIQHEGRTGAVDFGTDDESPTCLTTLQLSA